MAIARILVGVGVTDARRGGRGEAESAVIWVRLGADARAFGGGRPRERRMTAAGRRCRVCGVARMKAANVEEVPVAWLNRLMLQAVGLPAVVVLLLCGLLVGQIGLLAQENEWVRHTERVLGETNLAHRLLIDHQTGLRAYFLTGEQDYLEPYRQGQLRLPGQLAELRVLVADNPPQQARVDAVREQYEVWRSWADQAIAAPSWPVSWAHPTEAAFREQLRARNADMTRMRGEFEAIVVGEQALLRERSERAADTKRLVLWGGLGLLLGLGLVLMFVLRGWLAAIRRTYEEALTRRRASEVSEREARHAAEAVAADIAAQSHELERRFRELRDERDAVVRRLAEREPPA